MKSPPTNTDDVVDSRDVIARIDELESDIEAAREDKEEPDADDVAELRILKALAEDGEASPDWPHPGPLIRDTYFTEYAQEFAEDCCEVPRELHWPFTCIDWEQAAQQLQMDYMSVDFDGIEYWIRA